MRVLGVSFASLLLFSFLGCLGNAERSGASGDTATGVDHKHTHGDGVAHKHSHGESGGSHSHGHQHAEPPHSEPPHGGKLVSIGHSHGKEGVEQYHAEVMPLANGRITIHVLTERQAGDLQEATVAEDRIRAVVGPNTEEGDLLARSVAFEHDETGGAAMFVANVDESMLEFDELLVVVPKITLGGARLNFSFTVATHTDGGETSQQPDDAPGEAE